jgi:cell wall assembly regulator SMI1
MSHRGGTNVAEIKWRMTEGPLEASVIASVEERLGVIFPDDYKACVKLNNGGYPLPDSFGGEDGDALVFNNLISFTSSYLNMGMYVSEFKENRILPFARDPFGNHICFDYRHTDQNPSVVFWDQEEGEDFMEPVCDTFTGLLEQLMANEDAADFEHEGEAEGDELFEAADAEKTGGLESPHAPSGPMNYAGSGSEASGVLLEQPGVNGAVPDDRFEVTFDPIDAAEIESFEARHSLVLPEDFKAFLLTRNGGKKAVRRFETQDKKVTSSIMIFLPLLNGNEGKNLEEYYRKFTSGCIVPDYLLPIGTDPLNNLICVAVHGAKQGQVYYCDLNHLEEDRKLLPSYIRLVAGSFKEFYNGLFKSE